LRSAWQHPSSDGGDTFKTVKVEWDPTNMFNSRHVVTINSTSQILQGSYALSFGEQSSQCIEWNAVASGSVSAFEQLVEGITGITDVTVTRSGDASANYNFGYTYTVKFVNPVAPSKALILSVDQSACAQYRRDNGGNPVDVATETVVTASRRPYGEFDIDFAPEVQVVSTLSPVINEVQSVKATVDVTNERQRVHNTLAAKQDEIQTITTSSSVATAEVQKNSDNY
jgi:hypothetical protein